MAVAGEESETMACQFDDMAECKNAHRLANGIVTALDNREVIEAGTGVLSLNCN